jgi:hypothetical protein
MRPSLLCGVPVREAASIFVSLIYDEVFKLVASCVLIDWSLGIIPPFTASLLD